MKPYLVAVGGGSGSGKTTIVSELASALGNDYSVLVISQDNYYNDLSHVPVEKRGEENFDHPNAFDHEMMLEHLQSIKNGLPIETPIYDFKTHTQTGQKQKLDPKQIILFDGIMSLHFEDIRKLFDFTVFVDVPDDVRILRRLQRDTIERGRTVSGIVRQYLLTVREMHDKYVLPTKWEADLVVGWQSFNKRTIEKLVTLISAEKKTIVELADNAAKNIENPQLLS